MQIVINLRASRSQSGGLFVNLGHGVLLLVVLQLVLESMSLEVQELQIVSPFVPLVLVVVVARSRLN